jgi:hypothetical protein
VIITATVGYADASSVPDDLVQAACLIVADKFENREGSTSSDANVEALIRPYRNGWIA